jgi:hypothetical protein
LPLVAPQAAHRNPPRNCTARAMNIGEQIRKIRIWRALIVRNDGRKCTCAWCQRACEELDLLEQELLDYITA